MRLPSGTTFETTFCQRYQTRVAINSTAYQLTWRWKRQWPYQNALAAMMHHHANATDNHLWLCEHPPVYTLGQRGTAAAIRHNKHAIAVVATNRGGQITYHGPGQVVAYPLINLAHFGLYAKAYVRLLEQSVIDVLADYGVVGLRIKHAPGVYVRYATPHSTSEKNPFFGVAKIAALGVKISRQRSIHGVALNGAMDLTPFTDIAPCGYDQLTVCDLASLGVQETWSSLALALARAIDRHLRLAYDNTVANPLS